jgi:hypothetical protein
MEREVHLVELLLPLTDNEGKPFEAKLYAAVRSELTNRFGGVTAFSRSPAKGSFREDGEVVHDDIVVYEVMTKSLDRDWWKTYRQTLERAFRQDEIVIRAVEIKRL